MRIINEQIEKGRRIREEGANWVLGDFDHAMEQESIWSDYNGAWIERAFGEQFVEEYERVVPQIGYSDKRDAFSRRMDARILWLRSKLEQVPLMQEESPYARVRRPVSAAVSNGQVFIIHGHDEGARDAVALLVKNLGLSPIILQNRPNEGLSLDNKLEKYSHVDFAIAILTPDDNGNPRPNVALEWGWFRRAIGRERVCILYKEGTKIPSDMGGVGRTLMDAHGGWQQKIVREIKAAGVHIDADWFVKG